MAPHPDGATRLLDLSPLHGERGPETHLGSVHPGYAVLLTPQAKGRGPFTTPETFFRQAW